MSSFVHKDFKGKLQNSFSDHFAEKQKFSHPVKMVGQERITTHVLVKFSDLTFGIKCRFKYPNTLARTNLLCMKNAGTQKTMVSYLKK